MFLQIPALISYLLKRTLSGINNTIIDGTAINIHIFDEGLVHST